MDRTSILSGLRKGVVGAVLGWWMEEGGGKLAQHVMGTASGFAVARKVEVEEEEENRGWICGEGTTQSAVVGVVVVVVVVVVG